MTDKASPLVRLCSKKKDKASPLVRLCSKKNNIHNRSLRHDQVWTTHPREAAMNSSAPSLSQHDRDDEEVVFGAEKTRAAAVLIAGLMIMDPSLNLTVMTKENTAAKAFADHLLSLQLPASVYSRAGSRLTPIFPHLPLHHPSLFYFLTHRPDLSLWQVSPSNQLLPLILIPTPPSSPSLSHCGRSRPRSLLTLPTSPPFRIPIFQICILFGPACHCGRFRLLHPHYFTLYLLPPLPSCHSVFEARLVIVAGPAWSSPSTSPPCLFSLLSLSSPLLSLSSCCPARAGRHGRSKVIFLPLCH